MNAYVAVILIITLIVLTPLAWANLYREMDEKEQGKIGISLKR